MTWDVWHRQGRFHHSCPVHSRLGLNLFLSSDSLSNTSAKDFAHFLQNGASRDTYRDTGLRDSIDTKAGVTNEIDDGLDYCALLTPQTGIVSLTYNACYNYINCNLLYVYRVPHNSVTCGPESFVIIYCCVNGTRVSVKMIFYCMHVGLFLWDNLQNLWRDRQLPFRCVRADCEIKHLLKCKRQRLNDNKLYPLFINVIKHKHED